MAAADDRTGPDRSRPTADDEGALRRWSRLKQAARTHADAAPGQAVAPAAPATEPAAQATPETPVLTDADMPALESLDASSDYSGFLSPGVSEQLRKLALRKLFHSPAVNVRDGLDDYDDDYRNFETLGKLLVDQLRERARKAYTPAAPDADDTADAVAAGQPAAGEEDATGPDATVESPGPDTANRD